MNRSEIRSEKLAELPAPWSVSRAHRWLVAARPWALPASMVPVLFGTSLAVVVGSASFRAVGFVLAILGMGLLHTAANMLSDVWDWRRGLDREPTPVSGAIVRGWLTDGQVLRASLLLLVLGIAIGIWLATHYARALWAIGAVGVAIGLAYPWLKAWSLGDLAVFVNFAVLGTAGAWAVQTGRFSSYPVVAAIPLALLVVAILHANNWRDVATDRARHVTTVAGLLGDAGSLHYYGFLLFAPFGLLAALIWSPRIMGLRAPALPLSAAFAFLAFPMAARLWLRAVRRHCPTQPVDFIALDGATAQLNLLFGGLLTVGVAAAAVWAGLR